MRWATVRWAVTVDVLRYVEQITQKQKGVAYIRTIFCRQFTLFIILGVLLQEVYNDFCHMVIGKRDFGAREQIVYF